MIRFLFWIYSQFLSIYVVKYKCNAIFNFRRFKNINKAFDVCHICQLAAMKYNIEVKSEYAQTFH